MGEFDRIDRYLKPLAAGAPGSLGLVDDAAVLDSPPGTRVVVSTDTMVEDVHWFAGQSPALVARKLLRVNLSDLAAMGAQAWVYTLNTALPDDLDDGWLATFAAGLATDQKFFGIDLIGGDSVSTKGPCVVTITAFGLISSHQKLLRRSAAERGHNLFVTGTIGDAFLGLQIKNHKLDNCPADVQSRLVERLDMPTPRLEMGKALAETPFSGACLDVSDGLVGDAAHMAHASNAGIEIDVEAVPLSGAARSIVKAGLASPIDFINGGDDYELLFSASNTAEVMALARKTGTPVTRIGRIAGPCGVRTLDSQGRETLLPSSWTHF